MSLVKRGTVFHFDFWYRGIRYQGTTEQRNRDDAQIVEDRAKERLRREAHGLIQFHPKDSPSISAFAEGYLVEQSKRLTRPDILKATLRQVLGFWGTRPRAHAITDAPYHDLRLIDPIRDPRWLDRFEQWMADRKLSGSTRNSYLSAMSGLYKLAANSRYRARTGIDRNPFKDVGRHQTRVRQVTTTPDDVRRWMQHAAPHVRLALAIGALAHKLRLAQVLALRFDRHIDADLTRITFDSHKTIRHTRKPQVTVISADLRRVLEAARQARPRATYVITFRGKPVGSIKTAARLAATRAGLAYGLKDGGITFHALRHLGTTTLARLGVSAALAAKVGGHADPRTTEKHYTHLIDQDEQIAVDRLAEQLGLTDDALRGVGTPAGTTIRQRKDSGRKSSVRAKRHLQGKQSAIH